MLTESSRACAAPRRPLSPLPDGQRARDLGLPCVRPGPVRVGRNNRRSRRYRTSTSHAALIKARAHPGLARLVSSWSLCSPTPASPSGSRSTSRPTTLTPHRQSSLSRLASTRTSLFLEGTSVSTSSRVRSDTPFGPTVSRLEADPYSACSLLFRPTEKWSAVYSVQTILVSLQSLLGGECSVLRAISLKKCGFALPEC